MFKKDANTEFIEEQLDNGHIKKYIKGRTLGKGGFAQCYQFISEQTGKHYAAKVIDKQTLGKGKAKQKLQSQIMIHKSLKHKNIVKFEHFFEDHQFVYILLQLCPNNTLNELLKRRKVLTQMEVKYYILQLLHALDYIHRHKVIHRDLKLGNFFLNQHLQLKVGDFGLATTLTHDHERRKTVCGTPNYIAPEILQSKKGHSYEVDIWSVGVIVFALIFGKPPFETNQVKLTYQKIKKCDYSFPKSKVSEPIKNFIRKMLVLNPADRATLDQILADNFLNDTNIPSYLPLSTLACPPSSNFLEQVNQQPQRVLLSYRKESQHEYHVASSRTSKESIKVKCNISQKIDSLNHRSTKPAKYERTQGSLTRQASSALITKKKLVSCLKQEKQITYIQLFEDQPKYGMFYILSNKIVSMRFNDRTILCSTPKYQKFKYISTQNCIENMVSLFENGSEPEFLHKKMKIINHFSKIYECKQTQVKLDYLQKPIYLVAFKITNNYTLFELSNNTFQAKFKDNSDILIDNQHIHFMRKGKRNTFKAATIETQPQELRQKYHHVCALIKRLKKAKTVMAQQKKQNTMTHSTSHTRIIKKVESKPSLQRQFSSTSNLQVAKKPLIEFCSNKRNEQLFQKVRGN